MAARKPHKFVVLLGSAFGAAIAGVNLYLIAHHPGFPWLVFIFPSSLIAATMAAPSTLSDKIMMPALMIAGNALIYGLVAGRIAVIRHRNGEADDNQ
jgi:hypothetical protein